MATCQQQAHCGDHFEMYGNTKSLCYITETNIVLQVNYTLKTNKFIEKEIKFVVIIDGEMGK